MLDDDLLLRQKPNVDYKSLPASPTPQEFFLLSRVSGEVSVGQLCSSSGLGRKATLEMLERLLSFGLVERVVQATVSNKDLSLASEEPSVENAGVIEDDDDLFEPGSVAHKANVERVAEPITNRSPKKTNFLEMAGPDDELFDVEIPAKSPPASSQELSARSITKPSRVKREVTSGDYSQFPTSFDDFEPDAEVMKEGEDLDVLRKKEILYVEANLEAVNYYQLLGVSEDVDKKSLRKSYFALSKRFHPDQYFRQDVGSFNGRIEKVFKRITNAYEVLSHRRKRKEYDEELSRAATLSETTSPEESARKKELAYQVLLKRAEKLEEQGQFFEAASEYRKAVSLKREEVILVRIASLLLRSGQKLSEAAIFCRAALSEDPSNVEAWLLLGSILEKNMAAGEALEAYEEALSLAPEDPSIRLHIERIRATLQMED